MVALWAEEQQPMGGSSQTKKNTQGRGRIHCVLQYVTMSEMYRVTPLLRDNIHTEVQYEKFLLDGKPFSLYRIFLQAAPHCL